MGTYVYYYLGDETGMRTRFLADLASYSAWFRALVAEYPEDYPPGQLQKLVDIEQRGIEAFKTGCDDEAHVIDRILDEYWNFCSEKDLHRKLEITPSAHKRYRYADNLSDVLPATSATANAYYKQLFSGRSSADCSGHAYASEDGIFHVSWLLSREVSLLLSELLPYERQLDLREEHAAGVFWILTVLKEAERKGASLVAVVA